MILAQSSNNLVLTVLITDLTLEGIRNHSERLIEYRDRISQFFIGKRAQNVGGVAGSGEGGVDGPVAELRCVTR